ncbi:hypothetical protein [Butyrivibrio sp. INlla21]|uniref:hypothetical protein n=1 Tax=Butyrivibrio sp. INlla21 TaxID=1520811 RepID=UPI0008EFECE7|nr:hypothetical protein [Butyrivibrio sp. INlla21]SFU30771.1 hypothetical protein SAMN02910342_00007 [Butyrivibrio sp. INlla21]SFU98172.1 hypothetical protein SAMN02910342_02729 [Butyrivibrio sp. INlla21]
MKYEFIDDKNTMVITTKNIVSKEKSIVLVSHDEDDGMWEVLEGEEVKEEDAMIISLYEMVNIDPTVNQVADLPLGWIAYRDIEQDKWIKQKN